MLILKDPIILQSILTPMIRPDNLGGKICGNYQAFGAKVTGEDLIHMTMQEPDIYVEIENNGPFLVEPAFHMDNRVRLELVNHLVNRLLLYDSPQFTYQDEVFVAAALQKFGVSDVNTFMRQMKLHMEENKLAVSLLNRYFEEGREFARTVSELLEHTFSDRRELRLVEKEHQSERCLHNRIFKRLMTAECSNILCSYQNPAVIRESAAESFHTLEWMRQADRIQLAQFRENIYHQESPALFSDHYSYEIKPLAAKELTPSKIIGRMSAVILENMVALAGYALEYMYGSTDVWKDYSRIFYGSSENALERFHYFQEYGTIGDVQLNAYTVHRNELMRDELHLTKLLEFVSAPDDAGKEDEPYEKIRQSVMLTMLENQNFLRQLAVELQTLQRAGMQPLPDTYYLEERNEYREERNRFEAVYRILRRKRNENEFSPAPQGEALDRQTESLKTEKALLLLTEIDGENTLRERRGSMINETGGKIRNMVPADSDRKDLPPRVEAKESGWAVYELIHRYAESGRDAEVPLMENIELLEQINQHNLYMKRLLDGKEPPTDTPGRVVVDKEQAREAALRALENPGQVLREIYENVEGKRKIPPGTADRIPAGIERILSVTDAGTRSYYERLMGYKSKEASGTAPERGGAYRDEQILPGQSAEEAYIGEYPEAEEMALTWAKQGRRGELWEEIGALLRWIESREQVRRFHRAVQTGEVLRQIQDIRTQRQTADIEYKTDLPDVEEMIASGRKNTVHRQAVSFLHETDGNVRMVHRTRRQTDQEIMEEVLETIQNGSLPGRAIEEKSEDTLQMRQQLEQIRNELITKSREQIMHTVEHSMKTHVHELSDMVYLELERRLKNEQRRRGY